MTPLNQFASASSLSSTAQPGILRCLRYRLSPLDLTFEVPAGAGSPQTLWRLLSNEMPQDEGPRNLASYAGGQSLQTRLKLAQQLSEAVVSVHRRNLVHKNVRSNSTLMFKTGNMMPKRSEYLNCVTRRLFTSLVTCLFQTAILTGRKMFTGIHNDRSFFKL